MQQSQKELLLQILTIINYSKDKEKFIKEFEVMNYLEALVGMLEKVPEQIRETIKDSAKKGNIEEIKKHLSYEEYTHELKKTSDNAVIKFVEVISPVITFGQKQKITKLLHS